MNQIILTDDQLWNGIKDGDKNSLAGLYQLYYKSLYRYGNRIIPDTATIEDVIQDLFVTIWNTRHKLPELRNVKSYLFTVFRREVIHKSKKEHVLTDIETVSESLNFNFESDYEHQDYEKWLVAKLTDTLQSLPKRQLDVVILRYYENFQTSEIASIMGITEKSVRNTLHKAISHLRVNIQSLDYLLFLICYLQLL